MSAVRRCHFLTRSPLHQEGKWHQQRNDQSENKECADERQHVRLRIDHLLKLRTRLLPGAATLLPVLIADCLNEPIRRSKKMLP